MSERETLNVMPAGWLLSPRTWLFRSRSEWLVSFASLSLGTIKTRPLLPLRHEGEKVLEDSQRLLAFFFLLGFSALATHLCCEYFYIFFCFLYFFLRMVVKNDLTLNKKNRDVKAKWKRKKRSAETSAFLDEKSFFFSFFFIDGSRARQTFFSFPCRKPIAAEARNLLVFLCENWWGFSVANWPGPGWRCVQLRYFWLTEATHSGGKEKKTVRARARLSREKPISTNTTSGLSTNHVTYDRESYATVLRLFQSNGKVPRCDAAVCDRSDFLERLASARSILAHF